MYFFPCDSSSAKEHLDPVVWSLKQWRITTACLWEGRAAVGVFNPWGDQGWWGRVHHSPGLSLLPVSMPVTRQHPPMSSRMICSVPGVWTQSWDLLQSWCKSHDWSPGFGEVYPLELAFLCPSAVARRTCPGLPSQDESYMDQSQVPQLTQRDPA